MELRATAQDYLQECENLHFRVEVVNDADDEEPYLLHVTYGSDVVVEQWVREQDINTMLRILQQTKRERKRLTGE